MLTGELRSQIDSIWNAFWSGGISNPLEVMEQITYLLFLRRLDDLYTLEENKTGRLHKPIERRIFQEGLDAKGCDYNDLRALVAFQELCPGGNLHRSQRPRVPFPARHRGRRLDLCAPHERCTFHHPHPCTARVSTIWISATRTH